MRRIVLGFLLAAGPVAAQPVMQATGSFEERLTDRVPVSGRPLVGLLSVSTPQPPDGTWQLPESTALPLSLTVDGMPVCVRAMTQDGRYWTESSFVVRGTLPKSGRAGLGWSRRYLDGLHTFPLGEVAAVARKGSCGDKAEVIPVMLGKGETLGILQVLVNTRGAAVTAALRGPEDPRTLRRANCSAWPAAPA